MRLHVAGVRDPIELYEVAVDRILPGELCYFDGRFVRRASRNEPAPPPWSWRQARIIALLACAAAYGLQWLAAQ